MVTKSYMLLTLIILPYRQWYSQVKNKKN